MRVLIGCAGGGTRWNGYLGIPKHFAPVEGETLLGRTVRQLNDAGIRPTIVAHTVTELSGMYDLDGADTEYVSADQSVSTDKYLCSRHLWSPDGPTVQLWGDVWYSDEAIAAILAWTDPEWRLFGRLTRSRVTGCRWAEPFGLVFHPHDHDEIVHHLEVVTELWRGGVIDRCTTWEWYRSICGLTGPDVRRSSPQEDLGHLTQIDDWTDDFDLPSDYERWTSRRPCVQGRVVAGHNKSEGTVGSLVAEYAAVVGYRPYPGTLNVLAARPVDMGEPAGRVREFSVWPVTVDGHPGHVIRSDHWRPRPRLLEIIAPIRLRDVVGKHVTVTYGEEAATMHELVRESA